MLVTVDTLAKRNVFPRTSPSAFLSLFSSYFVPFPLRILSSIAGGLGGDPKATSLACISSFLGLPRFRLTSAD